MTTTTGRHLTPMPDDAFTAHIADCLDCAVRLDGSGPVCPQGEAALASVDWPAVSAEREAWQVRRDAYLAQWSGTESSRLLDELLAFRRSDRRRAGIRKQDHQ